MSRFSRPGGCLGINPRSGRGCPRAKPPASRFRSLVLRSQVTSECPPLGGATRSQPREPRVRNSRGCLLWSCWPCAQHSSATMRRLKTGLLPTGATLGSRGNAPFLEATKGLSRAVVCTNKLQGVAYGTSPWVLGLRNLQDYTQFCSRQEGAWKKKNGSEEWRLQ